MTKPRIRAMRVRLSLGLLDNDVCPLNHWCRFGVWAIGIYQAELIIKCREMTGKQRGLVSRNRNGDLSFCLQQICSPLRLPLHAWPRRSQTNLPCPPAIAGKSPGTSRLYPDLAAHPATMLTSSAIPMRIFIVTVSPWWRSQLSAQRI